MLKRKLLSKTRVRTTRMTRKALVRDAVFAKCHNYRENEFELVVLARWD